MALSYIPVEEKPQEVDAYRRLDSQDIFRMAGDRLRKQRPIICCPSRSASARQLKGLKIAAIALSQCIATSA